MESFFFPLFLIITYFSGSIPSGVIVAKLAKGIDPRTAGSNNPGTTNVARLCGFKYGVITLIGDIAKGFLPVYIATLYFPNPYMLSLVAFIAIFGHLKSCFLNFEGGKGVATLVGSLLPLVFLPLLVSALICVLVILRSGFVSLGALTMALLLPFFCLLFGYFTYIPLALVIFLVIYWTHRQNIVRLLKNEEKPWRKSKFEQSSN